MLLRLKIKNYALIEELDMDFHPGFSVITGETGAGKSILMGALGLILGKRANTSVLKDKTGKCVVEGEFLVDAYDLDGFFEDNDLDYEKHAILRREINSSGKSRAFINDTPVTLNILKVLADKLVDIHSQHTTITLNDSDFQLAVVDNVAGITGEVDQYRRMFAAFREQRQSLAEMEEKDQKSRTDLDYTRFMFDELEAAALTEGEQDRLEEELNMLSHSEEIKGSLLKASHELSASDESIIGRIEEVKQLLSKSAAYHKGIETIVDRLSSNIIDLKDIAGDLDRLEQDSEYQPALLEGVNARLEIIYRLQQKHGVHDVDELITTKKELEEKLNSITSLAEEINRLRASIKQEGSLLMEMAGSISDKRKKVFKDIEKGVTTSLTRMGMPEARFRMKHARAAEMNYDGIDRVTFMFNANKGYEPEELSNIASGGELSRLMLSVKSLISQKNLLPTIIFDEIDSGISGDVAGRVGELLLRTSENMQVVVITHLPQIAGKGHNHYMVFKRVEQEVTRSFIKKLDDEDRVEEIAKMLSGPETSRAARETARELIVNNQ